MTTSEYGFWVFLSDDEVSELYRSLKDRVIDVQFETRLFEFRTTLGKYLHKEGG
ncbi:MAG: hypothetical protein ABIG39_06690 [Candidatus Micrarchaeota archaeon]